MYQFLSTCTKLEFVYVAALEREVHSLVRRWHPMPLTIGGAERTVYWSAPKKALLVCAGTGWERAYEAAKACLERFSPQLVVSIGFAGACHTGLAPGAVVVPGRVVVPASGKEFLCAFGDGVVVILDKVAGTDAKRQASERYGALAVEMEAAGVAAAAAESGREFAAIKTISDAAGDELDFLAPFVTAEGFATSRFLGHIALRPQLWRSVAALQRNSKSASVALETAVGQCCNNRHAFAEKHSGKTHIR